MKLASLKSGGRDGTLAVVDRELTRAVTVPQIAPTLQFALEGWRQIAPQLQGIYIRLCEGRIADAFQLDWGRLAAPLPRAYQWLDGSAYLAHVERVRRARGAELPPSFQCDPLMYQGGSDGFLGPCDPIQVASEEWGIDFEGELAVITDDVPMGVEPGRAGAYIRLFTLVNDVSLRKLIPAELAKGFGFVHGKPPSAFAPLAVTADELGSAWDGERLHLPLVTHLNGQLFGEPDAGRDMQFGFPQLIAHAAHTRPLGAGTIIGSGTVSNVDVQRGFSCLLERRVVEALAEGTAQTPFLRYGDQVRMQMVDLEGRSVFGVIDQVVQPVRTR